MKSAQIALWNSRPSTSGNGPNFYGSVQLPAALIAELAGMLQRGHGMVAGKDGEQVFRLRCSLWRRFGGDNGNGPIASGEIETPAEAAVYQAKKANASTPGPKGGGAGPVAPAPAQPPAPQWNGSAWVQWDGSGWRPCSPPTAPPAGPPPGWGAPPVHAAPAAAALPLAEPPAGWGASQQFAQPPAAALAPAGWGSSPAQPAQSW
jgi:hypothetical protein